MVKQILSCDWGTTSFRLRLVNVSDAAVLAEATNGKGIATVYETWLQSGLPENERSIFYKKILKTAVSTLGYAVDNAVPLIVSGMASATIGMEELSYQSIPLLIKPGSLHTKKIAADKNFDHGILLVSGVHTNDDVMRGEETMLLGCDIDNEEYLSIFPGTHSKHVVVKDGRLVDFKTFMTGEIFDLLANKSVLSKSIKNNDGQYQTVFEAGVKAGANNNLLNIAFHVRTNALFKKYTPEENYHYLSGLLIGYELSEIDDLKKNIRLVCEKQLGGKYLQAFKILSPQIKIENINADDALINGHCKLAAIYYNY